jgi:hypothetical protein
MKSHGNMQLGPPVPAVEINRMFDELAAGNAESFEKLQQKFVKAFPEVRLPSGESQVEIRLAHPSQVLPLLKNLARAAARGLSLVASSSSSRSSLLFNEPAVSCISRCCQTLSSLVDHYARSSADRRKAQVEVAVLAQSAGTHATLEHGMRSAAQHYKLSVLG